MTLRHSSLRKPQETLNRQPQGDFISDDYDLPYLLITKLKYESKLINDAIIYEIFYYVYCAKLRYKLIIIN